MFSNDVLQPSENCSFFQCCAAGRDAESQLKDVQQSLSLTGSAGSVFEALLDEKQRTTRCVPEAVFIY